MGQLSAFQITVVSFLLITSVKLVTGQISTPCTTSVISSFTPCANFITGSTNNMGLTTPSTTCCDALQSLMSASIECACLVISANVPLIPLPINQALALFLPQSCNLMNRIPAQCKATATPLPAPGPAMFGSNDPTLPPTAASPLSPQVSKTIEVAEAPKSEILQPAMAPAPAKLTPVKQKRPRKLQEFDQYI